MGVSILLGNPPPSPQALGCIKGALLCTSTSLCSRLRLIAWHGLYESTAPFRTMVYTHHAYTRFWQSPPSTGLHQGRCTVQRATPCSRLPDFAAYKGLTDSTAPCHTMVMYTLRQYQGVLCKHRPQSALVRHASCACSTWCQGACGALWSCVLPDAVRLPLALLYCSIKTNH